MTARATYEGSVKTVGPVQAASIASAQTVLQETINASGCNASGGVIGTITGSNSALVTAIKNANKAYFASLAAAEAAKQASLAAARETLRATGDTGPV